MQKDIFRLLMLIDNNAIETDDYFKWDDASKNELDNFIYSCIKKASEGRPDAQMRIMHSLFQVIMECENADEFEQAEILNRTLKRLENDLLGGK